MKNRGKTKHGAVVNVYLTDSDGFLLSSPSKDEGPVTLKDGGDFRGTMQIPLSILPSNGLDGIDIRWSFNQVL